jgi:UDP-glucose 4-epimerase
MTVFGTDYETDDGTAVRDYIHVRDVARAHTASLALLEHTPGAHAYNIGSGTPTSVKQVLDVCQRIAGRQATVRYEARRAGDPASLLADITAARHHLKWSPRESQLEQIVQDACVSAPAYYHHVPLSGQECAT